jgi:hypothetical protein
MAAAPLIQVDGTRLLIFLAAHAAVAKEVLEICRARVCTDCAAGKRPIRVDGVWRPPVWRGGNGPGGEVVVHLWTHSRGDAVAVCDASALYDLNVEPGSLDAAAPAPK